MQKETELFLVALGEVCLEHGFVLSGCVMDCKPSIVSLPRHKNFNVFIHALRELYLKHLMFVDCSIEHDMLLVQPFTDSTMVETRLDEMVEFGPVAWKPGLMAQ